MTGLPRALRRCGARAVLLGSMVLAAQALFSPAASAFSDESLERGFIVTVFGAEVEDVRDAEALRAVKKFTGPIHYHLVSTSAVDRRSIVRHFMEQLAASVENLDLAETSVFDDAQMVIFLVDRANYRQTIRATVWSGVDTGFLESNACSAVLATRRTGIERAYIYLVADEGFEGFAHCMVEEIAQSLGPANDSDTLPYSIFNDESELNVFGVFDWFLLNMLYDARIEPGMTVDDVLPLLPAVIADARLRLPEGLEEPDERGARGAIR